MLRCLADITMLCYLSTLESERKLIAIVKGMPSPADQGYNEFNTSNCHQSTKLSSMEVVQLSVQCHRGQQVILQRRKMPFQKETLGQMKPASAAAG